MSQPLDKTEQIRQAHAGLIHRVVMAAQNPASVPDLENILKQALDNGWSDLVATIRKILSGNRDMGLLRTLDEDDTIIIRSILEGIQNPGTLPDLNKEIDGSMAAPSIAAMVRGARTGDIQALEMLGNMATQMMQAGGDMARLAAIIRPLVLGERDPNKLCEGMSDHGEKLVLDILNHLNQAEGTH